MPTLYLHAGLHKTGTTAIQQAFARNRAALLAHGLFYPASGAWDGHHNLAWELGGDPRFSPYAPTIASLLAELAPHPGDALVSSEDFESFLARPAAFRPLIEGLRAQGRELCVLIYLRDRTAYAEALYIEMLRHGYHRPFSDFAAEILASGQLVHQAWLFQFDVPRVEAALRSQPDLRFKLRPYDGSSVIDDLLATLGLPADCLGEATNVRANRREPIATTLKFFCEGCWGRPVNQAEQVVIDQLTADLPPSSLVAGPNSGFPPHASKPAAAIWIEHVCSARTAAEIAKMAASMPASRAQARLRKSWRRSAPSGWGDRLRHLWRA